MRDLLVIVPVRGRPANAVRLSEAFAATAKTADLLLVTDDDDRSYDGLDLAITPLWLPLPRQPTGPKVNAAAVPYAKRYRALMFMGDDNVPVTPGWDEQMLAVLDAMGTGICYPNDLSPHADLPCSAMVSAGIVTALGWMCEPSLSHFFVDNVWGELGRQPGCLHRCDDVIIDHRHPIWGKAPPDQLYTDAMRLYWAHDEAAYAAWRAQRMAADVATVAALRGRREVPGG